MKKTTITVVLLFASLLVFSQHKSINRLTVLNPARSWIGSEGYPAEFKNIEINIQEAGTYANMDILLEVSAANSHLANDMDSLEFVWKFQLPEGSIIHDAWLWMNGIPVQAKLYERGQAQFIYESYVRRRVDPLIVYKDGSEYEARIFPGLNPDARKLQLSILVPANINNSGVSVPMPLDMFTMDDEFERTNINVRLSSYSPWGRPETPIVKTSSENGFNIEYELINNDFYRTVNNYLRFNNPQKDRLITYTNPASQEQFFQLIIQDTVRSRPGTKCLFVLDFSHGAPEWIYDQILLNQLIDNFLPQDSFNILYRHNNKHVLVSEQWISGHPSTIKSAISAIKTETLTKPIYDTRKLMESGIDFINKHGKSGDIYVMTSTKTFCRDANEANTFAEDLVNDMDHNYAVTSVDLSDKLDYAFRINNEVSYNNWHFWSMLANKTGGKQYHRFIEEEQARNWWWGDYDYKLIPMGSVLQESYNSMLQRRDFTGFNYDFGDAFIYQDYQLQGGDLSPVNSSYTLVGKYYGGANSNLEFTLFSSVSGEVSKREVVLPPISEKHAFSPKIWAAHHLETHVKIKPTPAEYAYVVAKSKQYNVLTDYTAFLALEEDTVFTPTVAVQNIVGTREIEEPVILQARLYPNPCTDHAVVSLTLTPELRGQKWTLRMTDLSGKEVYHTFGQTSTNENLEISLDEALINRAAGIYFVRIEMDGKASTLKMIKR